MEITRRSLLAGPALASFCSYAAEPRAGDGEYWRRDALDLMRLWADHAPDPRNGGFHGNLTRQWNPVPPFDQIPLLIGRHAYGFSTAFQLSGDPGRLENARTAADYLLSRAWDRQYGGWFDALDPGGAPVSTTKTVSRQIYVNAGLVAWFAATGSIDALRRVLRSVELQRLRAFDPVHGGWAETFNNDLTVASWGKNKHAHYDYSGALLLNLHLATRDPSVLVWARELLDLSLARMRDECGWFHGFRNRHDREWQRTMQTAGGLEVASTGAQLTAALALIRFFEQTGERPYLDAAANLVERTQRFAWNQRTGAWSEYIGACPAARVDSRPAIWWWIQVYGAMAQLRLHSVTREPAWLRGFFRSEEFFDRAFRDRAYGGIYASATREGGPHGGSVKASSGAWKTSYHEMEHALVNYLYLNLYVSRRPVRLHFRLSGPVRHFVSLVDDAAAGIDRVFVNGKRWREFDSAARAVQAPDGSSAIEVWLAPPVAPVRPFVEVRERIRSRMQLVMGSFPSTVRLPLDMRVIDETMEPGYVRKRIEFTAEPGDRVSAYLLIPDHVRRTVPAVICLHPTHKEGKGVPVGLAGDPGRNYAHELAQRGFVTLAPDYPGFGGYNTDPYELGYASATAKGIWNHMRGVDLLQSLPEVDAARIAAVGHSLGGHNALFLAAFDSRVAAVVTSCGFTSFAKYNGGNLQGWSHKGYMPRIAAIYGASPARMPFDFRDVLAAIAPRPVCVSAPQGDDNFDASGVDDSVESAREAGAVVTVLHPDTGHSFPDEARRQAYEFLDRVFAVTR